MERLGEDIVVDEPRVDGEGSHQQDDIAPTETKSVSRSNEENGDNDNTQEELSKDLVTYSIARSMR